MDSNQHFVAAGGAGAASITAAETAAYFRTSALPSSTLRKIWSLADAGAPRGVLTIDEFTTALKLIAGAQEGLPIEHSSIEQVEALKLSPDFGPGASASVATLTGALKLTRKDIVVCKALWESVTTPFETALSADEAKVFFGGSALPSSTLRKIWRLSDIEIPHGQLSELEFYTAVKLIAVAQTGTALTDRTLLLLDGIALPVFGAAAHVLAPILTNRLGLTAAELQSYQAHWDKVYTASNNNPFGDAVEEDSDGGGDGGGGDGSSSKEHGKTIGADTAADFFSSSGLGKAALRKVWRGAYTSGRLLSENDFYIALKLIALAQGGEAPLREHLGKTGCAIPTFNGPASETPLAASASSSAAATPAATEQKEAQAKEAAAAAAVASAAAEADARERVKAKLAALEAAAGPPDFARYDAAGKFALKGLFKSRALGTAPKDVAAMRAALAAANEALAAKHGNLLASGMLNYEHSAKSWGGSVASVTNLCIKRGLELSTGATPNTWEDIAKLLAENCELPLGAEFGDINAGAAYKDSTSEQLCKLARGYGLAVPAAGVDTPWFELVKLFVSLDAGLIARHTAAGVPATEAADKVKADKIELKSKVWELQVEAVSAQLAQLVTTRGAECPELNHAVALPAAELVELTGKASSLLAGDGSSLAMYNVMQLKKLQQRCQHRGVNPSPEESEAQELAMEQVSQGMKNPCDLCSRKMAVGAGTGQCWPWCQNHDGLDEDAMRRAKEKAARGLVHLEEAIKAAYGASDWTAIGTQAGFASMGPSELGMQAGKCRPKIDVSNLAPGSSQMVDRLVLESDVMKFMKIKVMAKRREMAYEVELAKSRKIAADLASGKDDTKMWHVFTRWEGAFDDEDKGVDLDPTIPPIPDTVGRANDGRDSLVVAVSASGAPPPPRSAQGLKSHSAAPRDFSGHACIGSCCDLHFNTGKDFDPTTCVSRPNRPTQLKFATHLIINQLPKEGFAVPFLALKDYAAPPGEPGYLSFLAGQTVFVWNESGDADAVLGEVGPDGGLWMDGWVGHGSERPLYMGDVGFGEGIEGYGAGVFPGDHVTKPLE